MQIESVVGVSAKDRLLKIETEIEDNLANSNQGKLLIASNIKMILYLHGNTSLLSVAS